MVQTSFHSGEKPRSMDMTQEVVGDSSCIVQVYDNPLFWEQLQLARLTRLGFRITLPDTVNPATACIVVKDQAGHESRRM